MATLIEKDLNRVRELHPNCEVVAEGVTGGQWPVSDGVYENPICYAGERNNLAVIIRTMPGVEHGLMHGAYGYARANGYAAVFGAGVGGGRGRRSKQWKFALVRL